MTSPTHSRNPHYTTAATSLRPRQSARLFLLAAQASTAAHHPPCHRSVTPIPPHQAAANAVATAGVSLAGVTGSAWTVAARNAAIQTTVQAAAASTRAPRATSPARVNKGGQVKLLPNHTRPPRRSTWKSSRGVTTKSALVHTTDTEGDERTLKRSYDASLYDVFYWITFI